MIVPAQIATRGRGSSFLKQYETANLNCLNTKPIAIISLSKFLNISQMFYLMALELLGMWAREFLLLRLRSVWVNEICIGNRIGASEIKG